MTGHDLDGHFQDCCSVALPSFGRCRLNDLWLKDNMLVKVGFIRGKLCQHLLAHRVPQFDGRSFQHLALEAH
jgi:hypothetical protein